MYKITYKKTLSENVTLIKVVAPEIAKRAQPGQFVVIRINEKGERIPLTIAGQNNQEGTIDIIFQSVGKTTYALASLKEGDFIQDVLGPLGHPTDIQKLGTVVCIAGGVGAAEIFPIARAYKNAGNNVITILGARTKDLLILQKELTEASNKFLTITDDGSSGEKGFVSTVLVNLIEKKVQIDLIYAIGPVPMMKAISDMTKTANIKTVVSLNPIMVDATGMCGACRVSIDGHTKFACVDGPEFDAHKVNWEELGSRLSLFKDKEKIALEKYQNECQCKPR
ncbi:MAG: sulfide/dihydroorotate dehydrogenase-like FAD/NAD-binding protein [Elusimicrobia bacterium]|nr:sulfide/dihydroorotate dehydrogenase-like FAD/NAD-binding protein [Elusimicrobiota bacterium]